MNATQRLAHFALGLNYRSIPGEVIERAKAILMERHTIDERAAFELLRDHARSSGRRVVDVAQTVLDGHSLLPRRN